jgi:hypothetical protein
MLTGNIHGRRDKIFYNLLLALSVVGSHAGGSSRFSEEMGPFEHDVDKIVK